MRTWRTGVALLLLAVAASSCSGGGEQIVAEQAEQSGELSSEVGRCGGNPPDGADPFEFAAEPGVWLSVEDANLSEDPSIEGASRVSGRMTVLGGDEPFVQQAQAAGGKLSLLFATSTAERLVAAERGGSDVFVRAGGEGDVSTASLTIAFRKEEFGFVGDCKLERFTTPFEQRFGADASAVVRKLVGSNSEEAAALLATPSAPSQPEVQSILNPEFTDPEVLSRLELGSFQIVSQPIEWVGPFTVCTKVAIGWSDCVDLSTTESAAIPVSAYVDPKDPVVEVWLMDDSANLSSPISRLGVIELSPESLGVVGDAVAPRVELSLPRAPSLAEVLKSPGVTPAGVRLEAVNRR
jgi:hypothetical protein